MDLPRHRVLVPRIGSFRSEDPESPPRKKRSSIACTICRARKTACNNARPNCSACETRGSICVYTSKRPAETHSQADALRRENAVLATRNAAFEQVFRVLKDMPEDVRSNTLQHMHVTPLDPEEMLRSLTAGINTINLNSQPSLLTTARAVLPEVSSQFELELLMRHPRAYPTLDLSESGIIASKTVVSSGSSTSSQKSQLKTHVKETPPHMRPSNTVGFDQRLQGLRIGFWTTVNITDEYAKGAISLFIETDHPTIGVFDADLFMRDLVACKLEFCSPLLVSSLLALASLGYSVRDASGLALSYEFEQEAEKLLLAEHHDSLTTLSSLALLTYTKGSHGQSADGSRRCAERTLQMGQRMKLFGVQDSIRLEQIQSLSECHQRSMRMVGWGAFNTVLLASLFYLVDPADIPPLLPIPEAYASTHNAHPTQYMPPHTITNIFASFCRLWRIVSGILCVYRTHDSPPAASMAFAYTKYQGLLSFADALPEVMIRRERTSSHAIFFHIIYHHVIVEIFRPFITSGLENVGMNQASTLPPQAIFDASTKQLRGLVLDFKAQHTCSNYTIFWAGLGLTHVASAALRDVTSSDWRFYFLFCIRSYQELFPAFPVCEGIVQGLLAMAVQVNGITSDEAKFIIQEFRGAGDFHAATMHVKGGFVLDFDLARKDSSSAGVETWVNKFQDIDLFNEFTEGVV